MRNLLLVSDKNEVKKNIFKFLICQCFFRRVHFRCSNDFTVGCDKVEHKSALCLFDDKFTHGNSASFYRIYYKINQARDKLSSLQYCRGTKRYDVLLISGARVRIFVDRCSTIQNAGPVLYFLPKPISAILQTDSMEEPLWKNMGMTLSTMRF